MKKRLTKPPLDPELAKEEVLQVRVTAYERQQYELAANKGNLSLLAWIRDRLDKAAKREA